MPHPTLATLALVLALLAGQAAATAQDVVRLAEVFVDADGPDEGIEYVELEGTPDLALADLWIVALDGDAATLGRVDVAVPLGPNRLGLAGRAIVQAAVGFYVPPTGVSSVLVPGFALENRSSTILLVRSPDPIVPGDDWDSTDDGFADARPPTVELIDGIGWTDGDPGDAVYDVVDWRALKQVVEPPDAVTRFPGDSRLLDADAWYGGVVGPQQQYRLDDPARLSLDFPGAGALTPAEPNAPRPAATLTVVRTTPGPGTIAVPANAAAAAIFRLTLTSTADTVRVSGLTLRLAPEQQTPRSLPVERVVLVDDRNGNGVEDDGERLGLIRFPDPGVGRIELATPTAIVPGTPATWLVIATLAGTARHVGTAWRPTIEQMTTAPAGAATPLIVAGPRISLTERVARATPGVAVPSCGATLRSNRQAGPSLPAAVALGVLVGVALIRRLVRHDARATWRKRVRVRGSALALMLVLVALFPGGGTAGAHPADETGLGLPPATPTALTGAFVDELAPQILAAVEAIEAGTGGVFASAISRAAANGTGDSGRSIDAVRPLVQAWRERLRDQILARIRAGDPVIDRALEAIFDWLRGVDLRALVPRIRRERGLATSRGVWLADVPAGSGPQDAGLRTGDVILLANGVSVGNTFELVDAMFLADRNGEWLRLTISRAGSDGLTTLAAAPPQATASAGATAPPWVTAPRSLPSATELVARGVAPIEEPGTARTVGDPTAEAWQAAIHAAHREMKDALAASIERALPLILGRAVPAESRAAVADTVRSVYAASPPPLGAAPALPSAAVAGTQPSESTGDSATAPAPAPRLYAARTWRDADGTRVAVRLAWPHEAAAAWVAPVLARALAEPLQGVDAARIAAAMRAGPMLATGFAPGVGNATRAAIAELAYAASEGLPAAVATLEPLRRSVVGQGMARAIGDALLDTLAAHAVAVAAVDARLDGVTFEFEASNSDLASPSQIVTGVPGRAWPALPPAGPTAGSQDNRATEGYTPHVGDRWLAIDGRALPGTTAGPSSGGGVRDALIRAWHRYLRDGVPLALEAEIADGNGRAVRVFPLVPAREATLPDNWWLGIATLRGTNVHGLTTATDAPPSTTVDGPGGARGPREAPRYTAAPVHVRPGGEDVAAIADRLALRAAVRHVRQAAPLVARRLLEQRPRVAAALSPGRIAGVARRAMAVFDAPAAEVVARRVDVGEDGTRVVYVLAAVSLGDAVDAVAAVVRTARLHAAGGEQAAAFERATVRAALAEALRGVDEDMPPPTVTQAE